MATFDELAAEALHAPCSGWDFSWLTARSVSGTLPWSYRGEVTRRASGATAMLDMGTGGGEVLAGISPRPRRTVATEAWPPNVRVAAARLRPLGVAVIQDEGALENYAPFRRDRGRLAFRDEAFPLVINRHEAFRADEVSRVLAPGGTFITQQVDFRSYDDLCRLLGFPAPQGPASWLPLARQQAEQAGLAVQVSMTGEQRYGFRDVGAVIYYLRMVSWAIPGYTLEACRDRLRAAHDTPGMWPLTVRQHRFLLIAAKPPAGQS